MKRFMKKVLLGLVFAVVCGPVLFGAPAEKWVNVGITNNPQVDAIIVENLGAINGFTDELLFDFRNTLYFTNRGSVAASPGIRLDHVTYGGLRGPLASFFNDPRGSVSVSSGFSPALLSVSATNLVNKGLLRGPADGVIQLRGQNVDLSRGGLLVDPIFVDGFFCGFASFDPPWLTQTNFYPDPGVRDIYWALSNAVVQVDNNFGLTTNFDGTVNVASPRHEIVRPLNSIVQCYRTNGTDLRLLSASAYFRYQAVTPTNVIVEAAFVANDDTSIDHVVKFYPSTIFTNPYTTIAVRLSGRETNVVESGEFENAVYVTDMLASETNYIWLTNISSGSVCPTFMPAPLVIRRTPSCEYFLGQPMGPLLTNDIFYLNTYSNTLATNLYAAYSIDVSHLPASFAPVFGLSNSPGRIDIEADTLNLERARFRGNSVVSIKTKHLVGSDRAIMDAETVNYDLGSTNGLLSVKSLVQPTVQRFFGQVSAYSEVWTNQYGFTETNEVEDPPGSGTLTNVITTNVVDIGFHVLFVDGRLRRDLEVTVNDLTLRSTNTVVSDDITLTGNFLVEGEGLTLDGDLNLFGTTEDWDVVAAPSLLYFTNRGDLFIQDLGTFGTDRAFPYKRFVNEGSVTIFAGSIAADEFENAGNILTTGGSLTVVARSAKLETVVQPGVVPNGFEVQGSLVLGADDLKARNYRLVTRSTLFLSVTNTLIDAGPDSGNVWEVGNGFQLLVKPRRGALLGTTLRSTAPIFTAVDHVWAAEDRGPTKAGFEDNAAIGRLELRSGFDGLLSFTGTDRQNAMYVDFLSLGTNIAAELETYLRIAPGLTIYFADASEPVEQLDGKFGERLRWVSDFAGPNSGVDVALADGRVIRVNRPLRDSQTIDSDGDGISNFWDDQPFSGVTITSFNVTKTTPAMVEITWEGLPGKVYGVEFTDDLGGPVNWQLLFNHTNNATGIGPVTVQTPLPAAQPMRFYRVTYSL